MEVQYHKSWSHSLQRDMEYKTYGTEGRAVLAFPSQDGRFYDWENYYMVATLAPWIESGRIRLITCDGIDWETWSDFGGDGYWRIRQHENWFNYIIDELLPQVRHYDGETFIVTGCSMGAFHAGNFFFRRPDIFDTVIALSGLYHSDYGFQWYHDELTYANNPQAFIRDMPDDHPWLNLYRQRNIILCVGQGRWEEELLESTRQMDALLRSRNIPAWIDYWGYDVDHDWCWWRPQLAYFMGKVIGN